MIVCRRCKKDYNSYSNPNHEQNCGYDFLKQLPQENHVSAQQKKYHTSSKITQEKSKDLKQKLSSLQLKDFKEFKLENLNGQFNCFLNVCLQVLWHMPATRKSLLIFSEQQYQSVAGIKELNLVLELQSFIKQVNSLRQTHKLMVNNIRRELFKLYYKEQFFNLNCKADAAEALNSLFKVFHGCQIPPKLRNLNLGFEHQIEEKCQPLCFVHKTFYIPLQQRYVCECGFESKVMDFDSNNFMQVMNASQIIQEIKNIQQQNQEKKKGLYRQSFSKDSFLYQAQEQLIKIFKPQNDYIIEKKCSNSKCSFGKMQIKNYIDQKCLPQIIAFNVNWQHNQIPSGEFLRFLISLPNFFDIRQLYSFLDNSYYPDYLKYQFQGMICFVGAHYFLIIRNPELQYDSFSSCKWRLYNDSQIDEFKDWSSVLQFCIKSGCMPTVLLYHQYNSELAYSETSKLDLSVFELERLEKLAEEQDEFFQVSDDPRFIEEQQRILNDIKMNEKSKQSNLNKSQENLIQSAVITKGQSEQYQTPTMDEQTKQADELKAMNKLHMLKEKYEQYGIYLFDCSKCNNFVMLHYLRCIHCQEPNLYFDSTLTVNKKIEDQVTKELVVIYNLINELPSQQSPLESEPKKEEVSENIKEEKNEQDKQVPESPTETKWLCPTCKDVNDLDKFICKCGELLENFENLNDVLIQIQSSKNKEEKKEEIKKEEKPLAEDEWICDFCSHINKIDKNDIKSCYCQKCNQTNEIVREMLIYLTNSRYQAQASLEENVYQKRNQNVKEQISPQRSVTKKNEVDSVKSFDFGYRITFCAQCGQTTYEEAKKKCSNCGFPDKILKEEDVTIVEPDMIPTRRLPIAENVKQSSKGVSPANNLSVCSVCRLNAFNETTNYCLNKDCLNSKEKKELQRNMMMKKQCPECQMVFDIQSFKGKICQKCYRNDLMMRTSNKPLKICNNCHQVKVKRIDQLRSYCIKCGWLYHNN